MRIVDLLHSPKARPLQPLVVRAGLGRTFGSLIAFLALLFLASGTYILKDALAHPREAQGVSLIAAAFAIALAALLLFYLLKPWRSAGMAWHRLAKGAATGSSVENSSPPSVNAHSGNLRKDLTYQRIYVDHARIRP